MNDSNEIIDDESEHNSDVVDQVEENEKDDKPQKFTEIEHSKNNNSQNINIIKNEKIMEEVNEEEKENSKLAVPDEDDDNEIQNNNNNIKEEHITPIQEEEKKETSKEEPKKEINPPHQSIPIEKNTKNETKEPMIKQQSKKSMNIHPLIKKDNQDEMSINIELKNKNEFVGMEYFDEASRVGFGVNDEDNMSYYQYLGNLNLSRKKSKLSYTNNEKEIISEEDINMKINQVLHLDNKILLYNEIQGFKTWKKFIRGKIRFYLPKEYSLKEKNDHKEVLQKKEKIREKPVVGGFKKLMMNKKKPEAKKEKKETAKINYEIEYNKLIEEIKGLKNENNEMKNKLRELEKMFDTNKDVNLNNNNNKEVEQEKEGKNNPEIIPINEEEILNNEEVR